jgi:hypothetical protein
MQMQFGTIVVIIGYFLILTGSLLVYVGNRLDMEKLEDRLVQETRKSEKAIRADISELRGEFGKIQKDKGKELKLRFPDGYQLFAVRDSRIIPDTKSSVEVKIDWSSAKILSVNENEIGIKLPDAVLPGNNLLRDNVVVIKNERGAMSEGAIVVNGWKSKIEILETDGKNVIASVGYVKVAKK